VHLVRPAILAGVLAAVCGLATAAPISLPFQLNFSETQISLTGDLTVDVIGDLRAEPAGDLTVETRLISLLEFPEAPGTLSTGDAAAPIVASADRVPEPPTGLTVTGGLMLTGLVLALRRKILRQEHRPLRRRVRREYRLMA
jgi:hypothetical protein